jgi:AraC-like DNA-binding protein
MRYLTSVRLGLATRLLVEPNAKVKEVAFQSGFASSSHFCSVFKREFDMSPLEFASTRRTQVVSGNDNPAKSD